MVVPGPRIYVDSAPTAYFRNTVLCSAISSELRTLSTALPRQVTDGVENNVQSEGDGGQ